MAVLDSAFPFPINPSPRLYGALVAAIPGRTSLTNECGRSSLGEHSLPFTALQGFSQCSGGAFHNSHCCWTIFILPIWLKTWHTVPLLKSCSCTTMCSCSVMNAYLVALKKKFLSQNKIKMVSSWTVHGEYAKPILGKLCEMHSHNLDTLRHPLYPALARIGQFYTGS